MWPQLEAIDKGLKTVWGDAPKDSVDSLRVDVSHEPTITLGVSFFMSVSVCKKFSFDPETPMLRLDELLGLKIGLGPYCTAFTNTVGNTNPGSADPRGVECEGRGCAARTRKQCRQLSGEA